MMKKQTGFTLIEMMVAMGITLVALAATMIAFKDATYTNQSVTLKSDLSDNLRAGVNLIEQDLIQAGTGIPTGGIPVPYTPGPKTCLGSGGAPIGSPAQRRRARVFAIARIARRWSSCPRAVS